MNRNIAQEIVGKRKQIVLARKDRDCLTKSRMLVKVNCEAPPTLAIGGGPHQYIKCILPDSPNQCPPPLQLILQDYDSDNGEAVEQVDEQSDDETVFAAPCNNARRLRIIQRGWR